MVLSGKKVLCESNIACRDRQLNPFVKSFFATNHPVSCAARQICASFSHPRETPSANWKGAVRDAARWPAGDANISDRSNLAIIVPAFMGLSLGGRPKDSSAFLSD